MMKVMPCEELNHRGQFRFEILSHIRKLEFTNWKLNGLIHAVCLIHPGQCFGAGQKVQSDILIVGVVNAKFFTRLSFGLL